MISPTFEARQQAYMDLRQSGTVSAWEAYRLTVLACRLMGELDGYKVQELLQYTRRHILNKEVTQS